MESSGSGAEPPLGPNKSTYLSFRRSLFCAINGAAIIRKTFLAFIHWRAALQQGPCLFPCKRAEVGGSEVQTPPCCAEVDFSGIWTSFFNSLNSFSDIFYFHSLHLYTNISFLLLTLEEHAGY